MSKLMKASQVTWKFSFLTMPSDERRTQLMELLAPIERFEASERHHLDCRDWGLYSYDLVEPMGVRGPGELVLHCLKKGELLGSGWWISWPPMKRKYEKNYSPEEFEFLRSPQSMNGLTGGIGRDQQECKMKFDDILTVSFLVNC